MMYYLWMHSIITTAIMMVLYTQANSEIPTTCSVVQGLPGLNGRDGRDGAHGQKGEP
ncbi:pulmonary surfactant-associated D-like, partial [Pelobates cultripes]